MSFQSEIRHSETEDLFEKVRDKKYGKYLLKITIDKARSFSEKTINFDFPVTALVGPNGGGKTTILGAAAIAYKSVKPGRFFAKSGRFDASMKNWKFEYELIDRDSKKTDLIRRSASFSNLKWYRDGAAREVAIFGVSRTVPATERPEMKRFAAGKFDARADQIAEIPKDAAEAIAKILDKDFSQFKFIKMDYRGRVTLLAGQTAKGDAYSEFHFGAGESSIIRMIVQLETMPDNSLILIEEIENGLHPVATIRLVEHLIDLARRKKIQAIFTTHSNDALAPLPSKAIWASVNGELYQGKLDISSLRAINGTIDARLAIFVEDEFAKSWVHEILRSDQAIAMDAIGVHVMDGDGLAVRVHTNHNLNPAISTPSVCIIDGDSEQKEDENLYIYRLPGDKPERYVFNKILSNIDDFSPQLTLALLRPYEEHERVKNMVVSAANTTRDGHIFFSKIGKGLGFISEARVREAFLATWAAAYPEEPRALLDKFRGMIPVESTMTNLAAM
ncbi:ATP-dependent nuclease [Delftia lacustris]